VREARSIPIFKFWPLLKGIHDPRTAIFQVAIRGASARRDDIILSVLPHKALQAHDVDTGNSLLHVF
jgi:hypothetical protein